MNDMTQTAFVMADATGKITQRMSMPRWMAEHQAPPEGGCLVFEDGDLDADYVKEGAVVPRPANSATLSGATLENLPVPCTVTVEGVEHACEESTAELSFSHPGTYPVTVSAWPMLDATFEVIQP
jgi:hypothetical protein